MKLNPNWKILYFNPILVGVVASGAIVVAVAVVVVATDHVSKKSKIVYLDTICLFRPISVK